MLPQARKQFHGIATLRLHPLRKVGDFATPETAPRQGSVCWHCPWDICYTKPTFPQGLKSAPEDVTTKAIAEMRSNISGPVPRVRVRSLDANLGPPNFFITFFSYSHHRHAPQSVRRYIDSASSRSAPVSRDERISGLKLFTRSLTTNVSGHHPRKCTPNRRIQR